MTITIDLRPEQYESLAELARRRGMTAEELARAAIAEYVRVTSAAPLDPALAQAVADSFAENDELYRRLAR